MASTHLRGVIHPQDSAYANDQANAKSIPSSIAHETADTTANILTSVTNTAGKIESIVGDAVIELND